jgi:zinc protease
MSGTRFGVALPERRGFSVPIQVIEGGGVTAWLVEDRSLPVVSLAWAWQGGAALDPVGREGRAGMSAALLSEGAGDLRAVAFNDALRDDGIGLGFSAGRDGFEGSFRALTDALPEALRLARLAMTAPRLDADALDRVKARAVRGARQALETPPGLARQAFWEAAFPGHPAGRLATPESLAAVTVEELRAGLAEQLRQGGVMLTAAGDIDPAGLRAAMAQLFEGLPAGAPPGVPPLPPMARFGMVKRDKAAGQSTLLFGQDALAPEDPDWEAFQVALRILAGRWLHLPPHAHRARGAWAGPTASAPGSISCSAAPSWRARCRRTTPRSARFGSWCARAGPPWRRRARPRPRWPMPSAFLGGSLPLQFTDSRRTASLLLGLRQAGRSPEWLAQRGTRLAALDRDGVARAAKRLDPAALGLAVAGQPQGL